MTRNGGDFPVAAMLAAFGRRKLATIPLRSAHDGLQRTLTTYDLIGYGCGCTLGAGIYSLLGSGVKVAGPAIVLSFLLAASACLLTGLAYCEFASRSPVAGSAYTYAYCSFGELAAWIIGWNLTLEYAIGSAAVARGWAEYSELLAHELGVPVPPSLYHPESVGLSAHWSPAAGLLIIGCTLALLRGAKSSSRVNLLITGCNLAVLAFTVCAGLSVADPANNWSEAEGGFAPHGGGGVLRGAGAVFFAYVGFDMVSSLAEEVVEPQKALPRGILGSLLICAAAYSLVSAVFTSMLPQAQLAAAPAAPLAFAFRAHGMHGCALLVSFGSTLGLTAATLTGLMGQPRIFYVMARDGLLPPSLGKCDERGVPWLATVLTGALTALLATVTPLQTLADAISIGTLLAFSAVNAGVLVLRYGGDGSGGGGGGGSDAAVAPIVGYCFAVNAASVSAMGLGAPFAGAACGFAAVACLAKLALIPLPPPPPPRSKPGGGDAEGSFVCPWLPWLPCTAIALNAAMIGGLSPTAWLRVAVWSALGLAIYLGYGVPHSAAGSVNPTR